MGEDQGPFYFAYLVRIWREADHVWRCTVENPHSGETRSFASLEGFVNYLEEQTGELARPASARK